MNGHGTVAAEQLQQAAAGFVAVPPVPRPMSLTLETGEVVLGDGCGIHHRVWGEGPPLVVLHGGPGGSGRYWYDGIPALGQRFRVYAPDLRGHGTSSRQPPYTLRQMGRDILDYMERLELRGVTLLGHSLGGPVALEAALADEERQTGEDAEDGAEDGGAGYGTKNGAERPSRRSRVVDRLVIVGGFATTRHLLTDQRRFLLRLRVVGLITRLGLSRLFRHPTVDRGLMLRVLQGATPLLDTRRDEAAFTHTETVLARSVVPPLDVVWRLQPDLASYDVRDRLGELRVPVLAMVGAHDALAGPSLDDLTQGIRDCDRMVLPDAGHNPFLEDPAGFLDALSGWVGSHDDDEPKLAGSSAAEPSGGTR